jgi:allantoinase
VAPLPDEHLNYPLRRYGMDHDRYDWSIMPRRPRVQWPDSAHLAVWVVVPLTWYPLTMAPQPRPPAGYFDDPYPNFRDYTHRDYGNRIGAFRVMDVLDQFGIRPTAPTNAAVCERYPELVREAVRRHWEIAGHGIDMGHQHSADLDEAREAAMVRDALVTVRNATGQDIRGWLSPGNAESLNTSDLLAANHVHYTCDWVNDELPYPMRTQHGPLWAMPYSHDINDATMIWHGHHSPQEFVEQVKQQFDWLHAESLDKGGRIFTLCVHTWCIGQPHRIHALERILLHIQGFSGVWSATGGEILAAYLQQIGAP